MCVLSRLTMQRTLSVKLKKSGSETFQIKDINIRKAFDDEVLSSKVCMWYRRENGVNDPPEAWPSTSKVLERLEKQVNRIRPEISSDRILHHNVVGCISPRKVSPCFLNRSTAWTEPHVTCYFSQRRRMTWRDITSVLGRTPRKLWRPEEVLGTIAEWLGLLYWCWSSL